jgi:hypothetical protein
MVPGAESPFELALLEAMALARPDAGTYAGESGILHGNGHNALPSPPGGTGRPQADLIETAHISCDLARFVFSNDYDMPRTRFSVQRMAEDVHDVETARQSGLVCGSLFASKIDRPLLTAQEELQRKA